MSISNRLLKEVYAPIAYATKSLINIATCEEAIYAYLSIIITGVCFVVDCWDECVDAFVWAAGELVGASEEPEIEDVLVMEPELLLMPSHDTWTIMSSADEILQEWIWKAMDMFCDDDVIAGDYWETPLLCGVEAPKALPAYRRRFGIRLIRRRN